MSFSFVSTLGGSGGALALQLPKVGKVLSVEVVCQGFSFLFFSFLFLL